MVVNRGFVAEIYTFCLKRKSTRIVDGKRLQIPSIHI